MHKPIRYASNWFFTRFNPMFCNRLPKLLSGPSKDAMKLMIHIITTMVITSGNTVSTPVRKGLIKLATNGYFLFFLFVVIMVELKVHFPNRDLFLDGYGIRFASQLVFRC